MLGPTYPHFQGIWPACGLRRLKAREACFFVGVQQAAIDQYVASQFLLQCIMAGDRHTRQKPVLGMNFFGGLGGSCQPTKSPPRPFVGGRGFLLTSVPECQGWTALDRDTCNSNGEVDDKGQCKCNRGYTGKACRPTAGPAEPPPPPHAPWPNLRREHNMPKEVHPPPP